MSDTNIPTSGTTIGQKAICLNVSFRSLGISRKVDTSEITVNADKSMLTVSKKLFESQEFAAIKHRDGATKQYLYSRALPSLFKAGVYLVPLPFVQEIDARLNAIKIDRDKLVDTFVSAYPALIVRATETLRVLFASGDYPEPDQVKAMFGMTWRYVDLGVPKGLSGISKQMFAEQREKANDEWVEAMKEVRTMLRVSMADLVDDMLGKLNPEDGKRQVFRAGMTDKFKEFLQTFSARNIADDAELRTLTEKAKDMLRGINGESIKASTQLQQKLNAGFGQIKQQLSSMIVDKPSRAITFEDE